MKGLIKPLLSTRVLEQPGMQLQQIKIYVDQFFSHRPVFSYIYTYMVGFDSRLEVQ